ncbi:polysaccharide pyruvyl transferase family protein [Bacillus sp. 31A1R]|uniref:Polysaccharide pyruvyl transferase family protein n=1 Tax=Robertmurraya mangrovi TaxID=3098077 RepID=A0ABU5IW72_9BACI|nr:polysaccharide pyruvyl transferase family protein [Bacillus sp. 31A1R]MDZ5471409.1 polysaccharide pyruvyl transferase family protein [Bacillus sp. 31A1R]
MNVLYLGWLGYKNIGDELMWDIFREKFNQKVDITKYKLIPSTRILQVRLRNNKYYLKDFDSIVLGGGSLLVPGYITILYNAIKVNKNINLFIWGSGIDWLEKKELDRFLSINSEQNKLKREFNHFKDKQFKHKLQTVIQHAKFIGVRGHFTYEYLKSLGLQLDHVKVTGDPGLLTTTIPDSVGNLNSKKVVINWGTANQNLYGKDEEALENSIVDVVNELITKGYEIYIYPIWNKDIAPCKSLYEKITDKKNVHLINTVLDQYQILELIKDARFTINFKLHANVLSAARGIPFIALGYRFKTFDFANFIGLDQLVISTSDPNFTENILTKVSYIENQGSLLFNDMSAIQQTVENDLDQIFEYFR